MPSEIEAMPRTTKDQRRERYLDIGASLVAESATGIGADPALAMSHVKIAEVARRAGVTKGALYHLWPSQESYWSDLLDHLLEEHRLFGSDTVAAVGVQLADRLGATPALGELADALFERVREDPGFFARISLFAYLHDEAVSTAIDQEFRTTVELALPAIDAAVTSMARRFTNDDARWDLAVSLAALLEGLCLQYRIDPARTPELPTSDGTHRTLFAAGAEALLIGHTVPDTSSVTPAVGVLAEHAEDQP